MKKIYSYILVLLLIPVFLFAKPKVAVFDLYSSPGQEKDAEHFTELLRVRLINSRVFDLVYEMEIRSTLSEDADVMTLKIDRDKAIQAGRGLSANYVLWGSLKAGSAPDEFEYVVELIDPITGQAAYAKDGTIIRSKMREEAGIIADGMIRIGKVITEVELTDVEQLVKISRFKEAEQLLKRYHETHPKIAESIKLESIIFSALGKASYDEARRLLNLYLFKEAYVAINEAIYYDPENQLYASFVEAIRKAEDEFKNTKKTKVIASINQLIKEERFDSAEMLLTALMNLGYTDDELTYLAATIRKGQQEQELWLKARTALWGRRYRDARVAIMEAIQINPSQTKYQEFMRQLQEEEKQYQASQLAWQEYRGNIKSINFGELFARRKLLKPSFTLSGGSTSYQYRLISSPDAEYAVPLSMIDFTYTHHWLLPTDFGSLINLDFFTLYLTATGGICFSSGFYEEISTSTLRENSVNKMDLYATGGVSLSFFSFLFGFGLEFSNGFIKNTLKSRDLVSRDFTTLEDVLSYQAGLDFAIWGGWNITDKLSLHVRCRASSGWYRVSNETTRENHYFKSVMVGIGYSGF